MTNFRNENLTKEKIEEYINECNRLIKSGKKIRTACEDKRELELLLANYDKPKRKKSNSQPCPICGTYCYGNCRL